MPPSKLCLGEPDLSVIFSTCSTESVRNVKWGRAQHTHRGCGSQGRGHGPPPLSHGSTHWRPHLVSKSRLDGFRGLAHLRTWYFRQCIMWSAHASSEGCQTSESEFTVETLATAALVPSHGTSARPGDEHCPPRLTIREPWHHMFASWHAHASRGKSLAPAASLVAGTRGGAFHYHGMVVES